MEQNQ